MESDHETEVETVVEPAWIIGRTGEPLMNDTRPDVLLCTGLSSARARCKSSRSTRSADVERPPQRPTAVSTSSPPEEVWALVRAAGSEQDAAIYLTAAFTGLRRGELVAFRWRDVDFPALDVRVRGSYSGGALTTPKSGGCAGPDGPEVAEALARLARASTSPVTTTKSSSA